EGLGRQKLRRQWHFPQNRTTAPGLPGREASAAESFPPQPLSIRARRCQAFGIFPRPSSRPGPRDARAAAMRLPIGVVVPTRNSASLAPEHLETMRPWLDQVEQVVVVDSFSKDGTVQLL